jgi:hypothetical protein
MDGTTVATKPAGTSVTFSGLLFLYWLTQTKILLLTW